MKKRTLIASGIIVTVLGTGLVFAGQRNHGGWGGHHDHGGHRIMHMIDKLERKLDLSEQQVEQLEQIALDTKATRKTARKEHMSIGMKLTALDPASNEYDADVSQLAQEVSEMARQRTLSLAMVYKQASAVLTEQQRQELREMIQKRMERMARRAASHQ
ncbi:MAG: hypothetical protein KTR18_14550 [Acidiferrobacterales bacterium]|nr:hypothetical protein [Acidiferrobacterales bacterium]